MAASDGSALGPAAVPVHELVAICPHCKNMEALFFVGDRLVPTRKYHQEDAAVYHDCGSDKPCRLYRFGRKQMTSAPG